MQREIKFRAWDKKQSKLFTVSDIQFNEAEIGVYVTDQKTEALPWDENIILMQFTGLKDKNGKEVYEGDIVSTNDGVSYPVDWVEDLAAFNVQKYFKPVVIGNIYENPELLTV
ncbi:hypothetical protein IVB45_02165 [Bradyrhizobium sp. 4]|uniref:YopX family protein n=1 Tax=Bradyrhizobium sp. 4 TaxID=2782678 RepID=UPI0020004866|nr:YopX family protein [Bradyrhizobium sp. 4]UPJ35839.1 hypothetical protein IVB45_02165 [Bradyrhizobium sp. 4]